MNALRILLTLVLLVAVTAEAQQTKQLPRIGYLSNRVKPPPSSPDMGEEAFRRGLRELGYAEGKDILIEHRYAEGNEDRLPVMAAELVDLKLDVIVSATIRGIRAAKQATKSIPIIMITTADPVAAGFVNSLARPGGNVTGLTRLVKELSGKRLELLKEAFPKISRVGIVWDGNAQAVSLKEYEAAGRALKVQIQSLEVDGAKPDLHAAFDAATKNRINFLIPVNALSISYAKPIADLAAKNRIATMCERRDNVEAGCLMSYSADETESYKRAAIYVDKILKGTKPSDLPVEQPINFEFIVNLKTANQIGVTIPPNVLVRATQVIK
jgi:putative tryptophan/tyrosine transport system substrate-binding protein